MGSTKKFGARRNKRVLINNLKQARQKKIQRDEWISCQTDANKLVQPGSRRIDEDYFPEDERPLPKDNGSPKTNQPDFLEAKPLKIKEIHSVEWKTSPGNPDTEVIDFNHDDKAGIVPEIDDEWVIKKQLCRCCLAEGTFDSLTSTAADEGITYENILSSLSIELFPVGPESGGALRGVCGLCAARMRDAHAFCQQVHASDAHFRALYARNCITVANTVFDVTVANTVFDDVTVANTVFDGELKHEPESDADADDNLVPETKEDAPEPQFKASKPRARKSQRLQKSPKKKQADVIPSGPPKKPLRSRKRKKSQPPSDTIEYFTQIGDQFKCKRCEAIFQQPSDVQRHFKNSHRYFKCKLCGKDCGTIIRLTLHKLNEHNIDERYQCNACDKIFNRKQSLIQHINGYHMLGEVIKCSMCDFDTYSKSTMFKHMFKHKTTKDYHCKYCKKSFLRKTTLNFHERIHTGDKRKVCAECGQAFVQKASLNYHMAKYHPGVKF